VMTVVKNLALNDITICATIHSPTPYCFSLFDRILVLVRGEIVYHGPNGDSILQYLRSGCGVRPSDNLVEGANGGEIHNNADLLIDLLVGAEAEGRSDEYVKAYAASNLKRDMATHIEANSMVRPTACVRAQYACSACMCISHPCSACTVTCPSMPSAPHL
jgi:ATP-binding cassette, subfamily G (WHITE), member 2